MPSEMAREAIQLVGNTHPLAKGPWALGGRDDAWMSLDTDAGATRPGSRGEGIGKPNDDGVNVSEHLSLVASREGRFLKND